MTTENYVELGRAGKLEAGFNKSNLFKIFFVFFFFFFFFFFF